MTSVLRSDDARAEVLFTALECFEACEVLPGVTLACDQ